MKKLAGVLLMTLVTVTSHATTSSQTRQLIQQYLDQYERAPQASNTRFAQNKVVREIFADPKSESYLSGLTLLGQLSATHPGVLPVLAEAQSRWEQQCSFLLSNLRTDNKADAVAHGIEPATYASLGLTAVSFIKAEALPKYFSVLSNLLTKSRFGPLRLLPAAPPLAFVAALEMKKFNAEKNSPCPLAPAQVVNQGLFQAQFKSDSEEALDRQISSLLVQSFAYPMANYLTAWAYPKVSAALAKRWNRNECSSIFRELHYLDRSTPLKTMAAKIAGGYGRIAQFINPIELLTAVMVSEMLNAAGQAVFVPGLYNQKDFSAALNSYNEVQNSPLSDFKKQEAGKALQAALAQWTRSQEEARLAIYAEHSKALDKINEGSDEQKNSAKQDEDQKLFKNLAKLVDRSEEELFFSHIDQLISHPEALDDLELPPANRIHTPGLMALAVAQQLKRNNDSAYENALAQAQAYYLTHWSSFKPSIEGASP